MIIKERVLPYKFEPEPGMEATAMTRVTQKKRVNCLTTKSTICLRPKIHGALSWCGHWLQALVVGNCTLKPKAIESCGCHDKVLEYDEYDTC